MSFKNKGYLRHSLTVLQNTSQGPGSTQTTLGLVSPWGNAGENHTEVPPGTRAAGRTHEGANQTPGNNERSARTRRVGDPRAGTRAGMCRGEAPGTACLHESHAATHGSATRPSRPTPGRVSKGIENRYSNKNAPLNIRSSITHNSQETEAKQVFTNRRTGNETRSICRAECFCWKKNKALPWAPMRVGNTVREGRWSHRPPLTYYIHRGCRRARDGHICADVRRVSGGGAGAWGGLPDRHEGSLGARRTSGPGW